MGIKRVLRWLVGAAVLYSLLCAGLVAASITLTPSCASIDDKYDIAVVLGGGDELRAAVRAKETGRVHAAIRLLDRAVVRRLHLTGGGPDGLSSNANYLAGIARGKGVPESLLSLETQSFSTLQNALFSLRILPEEASLIVVTEDFHAWRAKASFLWAGRAVDICASPDPDRPTREFVRVRAREIAAWAVNIARVGVWSAAQALGLGDLLPVRVLA